MIDLQKVRDQWVGVEFASQSFEMSGDAMVAWSEACGETDARFIDRANPDFQAQPNFTAVCMSERFLPDGFPQLGDGMRIDGGKSVISHQPIRPGDVLTGTATIIDVFEKTGRSGTMVFIVQRMTFVNQNDELVSIVDWKMIQGV